MRKVVRTPVGNTTDYNFALGQPQVWMKSVQFTMLKMSATNSQWRRQYFWFSVNIDDTNHICIKDDEVCVSEDDEADEKDNQMNWYYQ